MMKRLAAILAGAFLISTTAFSQVTATLLLPVGADTTANSRYLNFYFGAMMAARDLGNEGVSINLEALDISSRNFLSFTNRMKLHSSDILIGPISTEDILSVMSLLPEGKPLISPLDTKTESLCDSLPLILASTPARFQADDAMNWLISDINDSLRTAASDSLFLPVEERAYLPDTDEESASTADSLGKFRMIVVSEGGVEPTPASEHIHSVLDTCRTAIQISYRIFEGVEIIDTLDFYCGTPGAVTKFFAASDNDVFIKDVLRQVAEQSYKSNSAEYYGNGKVRSSDIAELCAASTHMSSTFFVDYTNPGIQKFVLEYRAFFGTDPDSFAFHGYDVLHYFAGLCNLYGKDWPKALPLYCEHGLQTNFKFDNGVFDNRGAINKGVRRILYSAPYTSGLLY